MANKKSTKKELEPKKPAPSKADAKKAKGGAKNAKAPAKSSKAAKSGKNAKPGIIDRAKKYFGSVRSEMKRVTWPSKQELVNYSVAVVISLVVVGIAIAALDLVIGEGLALFAGLRG